MANQKSTLWRNLTLLLLGGAGLATWLASACGTEDRAEDPSAGSIAVAAGGVAAGAKQSRFQDSLPTIDHIPPGYNHVPGGGLWHQDCVHQVPDGAVIHGDLSVTINGATVARYAPCTHPVYRYVGPGARSLTAAPSAAGPVPSTGNGWVDSSWAFSSQPSFTQMNPGTWTVPATPPANDGQTLYFFPSLSSLAGGGDSLPWIVQPVLQWGASPAGGGAYWAYASWAVQGTASSPGAAFYSFLRTATPGDTMTGLLSMTNSRTYSGALYQDWTITTYDESVATTLNAVSLRSNWFTSAQAGVLEAYNIAQCNDFPSGYSGWTYFSQPVLYQGYSYLDRNLISASWSFSDNWLSDSPAWGGPSCNYGGTVDSNGNTTVDY
jgi:hypothetical protein